MSSSHRMISRQAASGMLTHIKTNRPYTVTWTKYSSAFTPAPVLWPGMSYDYLPA